MNIYRSHQKLSSLLSAILLGTLLQITSLAQKRRPPAGGRIAIVVDERLSVLRAAPDLYGRLLRRISRGKLLAMRGEQRSRDGLIFCRVNVSARTSGWVQCDSLISGWRRGDDERLLRLIKASEDFDRIARAKIFLDTFQRSPLRPTVLLMFGDSVEQAAAKLSRDASRRLKETEIRAVGAPAFSYYLNYNGLDRYARQGVKFVFDEHARRFHYDGAAWREILRRYPHSPLAREARQRLTEIAFPGTAGVPPANER